LYDALNHGRIDIGRLRRSLAGLPLPRPAADGRLVLAADVSSWLPTAVLDAVRLCPDDDEAEVTAAQVRDVITRLAEAGHWREGDPAILVVFDAGYDVTRLAFLLADLPVELLGRLRSDRVLCFPAPARRPGARGRPRRHGRGVRSR
jgi:hypothetical protein